MKTPDDSTQQGEGDRLEFVVGAELKLRDILAAADISALLGACMKCGVSGCVVEDAEGTVLGASGKPDVSAGVSVERRALFHEGEAVGSVALWAAEPMPVLQGAADMAAACLQLVITATAKRMFATELHTTVVHQSYDDLLETNRKLQVSESMYRKLSETLEQQVAERTEELRAAHARMLQQQKMASVGQLAAGMAHEINNPLGFISSNLNTLDGYSKRIAEALRVARSLLRTCGANGQDIEEVCRRLKVDLVLEDIPVLLAQSREGAERVRTIVADLKGFSHVDDAKNDYVDINAEIDRTISVLAYQGRDRASYVRNFGQLPLFYCSPGLMSQVFSNILQNALQATDGPVCITIETVVDHGRIRIVIADDGPGIAPDVVGRIFEPFFTTREVGKGMGLGLSVVYDIIMNHGGEITVDSSPGHGTAFIIFLPVKERKDV